MSSPCNDCSLDCFTDECPLKCVFNSVTLKEDWRSILDEEQDMINDEVTDDDLSSALRAMFPHGHEKFIDLCMKEMELHSRKNYDYAHGGNPLGNFTRVANILSNYPRLKLTPPVIALVYAMKQLDAVLWQLSQGYEGQVEGIDEKARDIHVYVKLFRILLEEA